MLLNDRALFLTLALYFAQTDETKRTLNGHKSLASKINAFGVRTILWLTLTPLYQHVGVFYLGSVCEDEGVAFLRAGTGVLTFSIQPNIAKPVVFNEIFVHFKYGLVRVFTVKVSKVLFTSVRFMTLFFFLVSVSLF